MTLIVQTFLSFSGFYLKSTNCWELNFSLTLFSQNILWRFYPKAGNPIPQKFSAKVPDREDFCQKAHDYYDNLKQNIWSEFSPVSVFSRLKDPQILFKVLSEL